MAAQKELSFQGIPIDTKSIAFDMADGCLTEIKEIFFLEGKYPPIVRWCSYAQSDWPKQHQILSGYWRDHTFAEQFSIDDFKNDATLQTVLPFIVHLKMSRDEKYEYDYIGERAAQFMNMPQNFKGDLATIAVQTQKATDLFNLVSVAACAIRGQSVLILSQDGTDMKPILWNKLIIPLTNKSGHVVEFLMCVLRMPAS